MSRTEQEGAAVREALTDVQEYAHSVHMATALAGYLASGNFAYMPEDMKVEMLKWLAAKAWQATDDLNDVICENLEGDVK